MDPILQRAIQDLRSQSRDLKMEVAVAIASATTGLLIGFLNAEVGLIPRVSSGLLAGISTALVLAALFFVWNLIGAPGKILADHTREFSRIHDSLQSLQAKRQPESSEKSRVSNLLIYGGSVMRQALGSAVQDFSDTRSAITRFDSQLGLVRHHESLYGASELFFVCACVLIGRRYPGRVHFSSDKKTFEMNELTDDELSKVVEEQYQVMLSECKEITG